MRRRWTTDQYMARYERRLERKAFNKLYDDVTHPPSPDGTRLCKNCVKNETCGLNRRRNHGSCFVGIDRETKSEPSYEMPETEGSGIGGAVLGGFIWILIIGVVILCVAYPALWCIAMVVLIFFVLASK